MNHCRRTRPQRLHTFLVPTDLALVTFEEEPLGARGFLVFAFTPAAFLVVVVLGVGLAF